MDWLNTPEFKNLKLAFETQHYKHLSSWKELYYFQRLMLSLGKTFLVTEIGLLASRKLRWENVTLPIDTSIMKRYLLKKMIRSLKKYYEYRHTN